MPTTSRRPARGLSRWHRCRASRCWWRAPHPGAHSVTEARENLLLDRETLEHGLDHEIRRASASMSRAGRIALAGRGGCRRVQPALVDGSRRASRLHALHARRERPLVAIDQRDRNSPRSRDSIGDARPHGARSHHADGAHAARRRAARRLALGEEQVAQRARRRGATAFLEAAARQRQRRAEGLATGGRHAVDDGIDGCDPRKLALCRGAFATSATQDPARRPAPPDCTGAAPEVGCRDLPREAAGVLEQIESAALAVDDAEGTGTLEVDGIAAQHDARAPARRR